MKMPKLVALIVAMCLVLSLSVLAIPSTVQAATYPCLFYGTATVDDEPVDAGTEITAWVGTEQVGSALTGAGGLADNEYTLPVELESPVEVSFKIGTLDTAETATWAQFGSVEVNLTATTEEEPEVPTYPCEFYGTALVDDESVTASIVTAWVGTEQVGSGLTGAGGLADNQFSLIVEYAEEVEVSFKIGTLDANETATWVQYGSVEVNLTASTGVTYPCLFYGTALVDNAPVAAGTEIIAWVGSEQVGSALTGEEELAGNQFCLVVELENPVEVSFKIGTLWASETATWVQYGSVEVNLTVTTPAPSDGAPAPTYYTETNLFGTEESFRISSQGKILKTIEATSKDGMLTMTIPEGTVALDKDGKRLASLEAAVDESPPDPPEDAHIIGLAYDFGPDGATFDPPITLTWSYDPEALPEGVAERDLVLAYYDEEAGEWVELPSVVDPVTHTIAASAAHFTTFAIIGVVVVPPPLPAAFSVSSLSIQPAEVEPGETVTIAVSVANTGGESGSYTVVLKIDGVKEDEERVTVAAGSSRTVSFSITREEAASYTVTVDGRSGSFTVVTVVVPPEPAAFSVSYLSVRPRLEVEPGETVAITVLVANTGGESGSYTVVLKIDGVKEAEETVTIAAGESQEVSFSVTKEDPGDYTVDVDGLSESFTVVTVAPPAKPGINWPLIGGIIGGVVVVGLGVFFWMRRRAAA